MAEQFYTILTAIGKAKIANSAALGEKVELTHLALGDGDGSYYNPTEDQTALKNEVWRGAIGTVDVDTENPNWITIQTVVPSQHGGFMIREAGVFDDDGDLIAVGKYPETYKPVAADGSIKDLIVRMILEVSNTASVVLRVDPTVVLATQQQVDEAEARAKAYTDQEVAEVSQALDAHKADHVRIELSESAPSNPGTNTWWYEDLGETADLGGGDGGLLLGNASTEEGDDVWFDEV